LVVVVLVLLLVVLPVELMVTILHSIQSHQQAVVEVVLLYQEEHLQLLVHPVDPEVVGLEKLVFLVLLLLVDQELLVKVILAALVMAFLV
jgi:hypothetical protein